MPKSMHGTEPVTLNRPFLPRFASLLSLKSSLTL